MGAGKSILYVFLPYCLQNVIFKYFSSYVYSPKAPPDFIHEDGMRRAEVVLTIKWIVPHVNNGVITLTYKARVDKIRKFRICYLKFSKSNLNSDTKTPFLQNFKDPKHHLSN